ncbi:equilibrative nucleoside transporter 2 [Frankliniella occidentalis]|uniref:Equilibrative nucleoside transporter 2 n=1 Tax=Frankliniella occidentalis TaxID=133901 RepID=A0A9C6X714_FRAOC|nr:equilibrative nucleoside transporter 2 [Frankliniella occidentalis]
MTTPRTKIAVSGEDQYLLTELQPRNGNMAQITPRKTAAGEVHEKQPFLATTEPVRLTPAWEDTNLPNDELNFKGVTMEQADLEMNPPKDRFNLVYLTLLLHGIGTLMPWNMFITPKDYFVDYKLGNGTSAGKDFKYDEDFLAYISFAAQVPNLLFNWLNVFVQFGGSVTTRVVWSILVMVFIFVMTVVLAMMDSSDWPGSFFWVTMVSVVILNMASGIYQNTVYGMGAKLPPKYTGAIVLGSNISGTFTAIVSLISLVMAPNVRTAAIYYFIAALLVLLACFDTYFALPLNRFYRYHELMSQKELQKKKRENLGAVPRTPFFAVFRKCYPQCLNVFMVFFVTLALFPTVQSDIKRSDPNFFIEERFYLSVLCFITFNACAMIGSSLSTWVRWPGPRFLTVAVWLRLLFIPLFAFCNYLPKDETRTFPIIIKNDWVYWGVGIVMGLTSGHFSSLAMMYCPKNVDPQHQSIAGMLGAAFLVTGIFCGILFSPAIKWFVTNVSWDIDWSI